MGTSKNTINKEKMLAVFANLWQTVRGILHNKILRKLGIGVLIVVIFVSGVVSQKYLFSPEQLPYTPFIIDGTVRMSSAMVTITNASIYKIVATTSENELVEFVIVPDLRITGVRTLTISDIEQLSGKKVVISYTLTTDGRKVAMRVSTAVNTEDAEKK
jgi:hypothetical protein